MELYTIEPSLINARTLVIVFNTSDNMETARVWNVKTVNTVSYNSNIRMEYN